MRERKFLLKRTYRFICAILAVIMLVGATAFADEGIEPYRASEYLSSYQAYCTPYSSGIIRVNFNVTGKGIMDKVGAESITIESDAGGWHPVAYISGTISNGLLTANAGTYIGYYDYIYATPGVNYRAIVACYAEKDGGSDSKNYTTTGVTAI